MSNQLKSIPLMLCILLVAFNSSLVAQIKEGTEVISSITIEECYQWSRDNYPLIKQLEIIDKSSQYNLSNASKGNLPQISLNGQATLQSEVTSLPIEIPNMDIPTIDKDQYKIYGEVYQPLTGFSRVKINKRIIHQETEVQKQQVEVDLYKLHDRINQLYFGVLLINEKIAQYEIIQSDLDSTLAKVNAAIVNGTATETDRQLLAVERISLDQKIEEDRANRSAFLEMLSIITRKKITSNSFFVVPTSKVLPLKNNRPELQLFNLQSQAIELQQAKLSNGLIPNAGLFAQGGYGRPALNFLSNSFDFYYVGGIRFNWNLSNLYTYKNSKKSLVLWRDKIASQKETFLLNNNLIQTQQSAEITKLKNTLKSDKSIIDLREEILNSAKVQLDNGLVTTIDYVNFLNDKNKAKQMFLLHETQLLLAQYNLKTTTGN